MSALDHLKVPFARPIFVSQGLESGASVLIDAAMAAQIMRECQYEKQRRINEDRALGMAEKIQYGTFRKNTQLWFARFGGRLILVDGYHRLTAVDLCGQALPFRIEIDDCRSMDEVDALYLRFDQPGGARTLPQLSRSLGLHDDKLRPATAALLIRAMPLLMMGLKRIGLSVRPRDTRDLDRKKEAAREWKAWALDYQSCLDCGVMARTARFRNGGVFAIALVTLRYQNERAKLFWCESARNSGLESDDPRHALHQHLLMAKRSAHEYDLAEAACNAWNAFYRNRRLIFCRVIGSPLRLLGTPFQGDE